tara:strand:+ start:68 stop:403 length:336 start_codon:yes stop_codon:yes gene_type:complete
MPRDILPLVDNDVLTLIGKEVIKIRDKKTLEYWMEFYTTRRLRLIDRLYPQNNRKIIIQTISGFNNYKVYPKRKTKIELIKRLEVSVSRSNGNWWMADELIEFDSDYDSDE